MGATASGALWGTQRAVHAALCSSWAVTRLRTDRVQLPSVEAPEKTRDLPDVTIRVRETSGRALEAIFEPVFPETHLARGGFTVNSARGAKGRTLDEVLDWPEEHWRTNYPLETN